MGDDSPACPSTPQRSRSFRALLLLLWLCFIARGCFYSALLPLWEGYDEPYHFSFIQYVAAHRALPRPDTPVSREVQASLHLAPLSWEHRLHALEPPIYTEDAYWRLPESVRQELQQQLRAIPPNWGMQSGTAPVMYEAQQAPLYYWLMAEPLRLAAGWQLAARVLLVRWLSVFICSLLVPVAWVAARQFFSSDALALGIVAVIVCMPELMIDICRAGNECLAVLIYSLLTLLLLLASRATRPPVFLAAGLVLGIGLLTKAYFLLAIPAFAAIAVYSAWRSRGRSGGVLLNAAGGLGMAVLICVAWYWRNHALTGTWSGEEANVAAMRGGLPHVLESAVRVKWIGGVTSVLISHIWFGGWSFLKLPKPIYLICACGIALALAGLVKAIAKDRFRSGELLVLLTLYAFFWLGLLYDILLIYVATGISACPGWYMYAVVLPEMLLVAFGLFHLVPRRWSWAVLPAMAAAFGAIDLYGTCALLAPYYTGLVAHVAGSDLVHANLSKLLSASPSVVLSRLTVNKPEWLHPGVFALLGLLYCAATILAVGESFAVSRARPAQELQVQEAASGYPPT